MTTGQRIAAKRKEQNLSQEALGEALGVSRQSIYKWESDTSLPDIDKLVALSRLFRVSVGWLLGVEEEPAGGPEPLTPEAFAESQEKLVTDILTRYQQSQPRPKKPRRWAAPALVLLCAVTLFLLLTTNSRLRELDRRYNDLANSIGNITYSVDSQIGSITNRVETILKAQNSLIADYGTQLLSADLQHNTATFQVWAVPKTYVEGMEVAFQGDSGGGPAEFPSTMETGKRFTAELTCELTDSITLSVVLYSGDTRQVQLLDSFEGLYSVSLPYVEVRSYGSFLHSQPEQDGLFHLRETYVEVEEMDDYEKEPIGRAALRSVQVGLFHNQKLVCRLEPCDQPASLQGNYRGDLFLLPETSIALEEGDTLLFAALYTDEYGREGMAVDIPIYTREENRISWASSGSEIYDRDNYTF